jgi:hypothetical protein
MKKQINRPDTPEKEKEKVPMNPEEEATIAEALQKALGEKIKVKKNT